MRMAPEEFHLVEIELMEGARRLQPQFRRLAGCPAGIPHRGARRAREFRSGQSGRPFRRGRHPPESHARYR